MSTISTNHPGAFFMAKKVCNFCGVCYSKIRIFSQRPKLRGFRGQSFLEIQLGVFGVGDDVRQANLIIVAHDVAAAVGAYTPGVVTLSREVTRGESLPRVFKNWSNQAKPGQKWAFRDDQRAFYTKRTEGFRIEIASEGRIYLKADHDRDLARTGLELIYDGERLILGQHEMLLTGTNLTRLGALLNAIYSSDVLTPLWGQLQQSNSRLKILEDCYEAYKRYFELKAQLTQPAEAREAIPA
jgi:hypothetical protein